MAVNNRKKKYSKFVLIIIRYSILSCKQNGWVLNAQNTNDPKLYEEKLFNSERMSFHENLFEKYTVPSLEKNANESANNVFFKAIIVTSEKLPKENNDFLNKISSNHPGLFDILYIDDTGDFHVKTKSHIEGQLRQYSNGSGVYATVRLDDDDAISDNFIGQLVPYLHKSYSGFYVSFGTGYEAHHVSSDVVIFRKAYYPKCAQALTHIDYFNFKQNNGVKKFIFNLNGHEKADLDRPCILDSRQPAYLYSIHSQSDVALRIQDRGKKVSQLFSSGRVVPHDIVNKSFSWHKELASQHDFIFSVHGRVICFDEELKRAVQVEPSEIDYSRYSPVKLNDGKLFSFDGVCLGWNGHSIVKGISNHLTLQNADDYYVMKTTTKGSIIGANKNEIGFKSSEVINEWEKFYIY